MKFFGNQAKFFFLANIKTQHEKNINITINAVFKGVFKLKQIARGVGEREKVFDLGDDGELGSQVVQADLSNLYSVDCDFPFCRLQQTEQTQCHGGLACSGPTHDTNLQTNADFSNNNYISVTFFLVCLRW